MEAITFVDLVPILASVVGPILLFAVAIMRYQHIDSTKTRDLIDRNRDLIEARSKESRDLIDRNRGLIDRNRDLIEARSKESRDLIEARSKESRDLIEARSKESRDLFHKYSGDTNESLKEIRERLVRIENRILPPPSQDEEAEAA